MKISRRKKWETVFTYEIKEQRNHSLNYLETVSALRENNFSQLRWATS